MRIFPAAALCLSLFCQHAYANPINNSSSSSTASAASTSNGGSDTDIKGFILSPAPTSLSYGFNVGDGVAPETHSYFVPGLGPIYSHQSLAPTIAGISALANLYKTALSLPDAEATMAALCASDVGRRGLASRNVDCDAIPTH